VGRSVRCRASSVAPPASRKPLLAGSAKNILAAASRKAHPREKDQNLVAAEVAASWLRSLQIGK
jgi:hypothetical protein